MNDSNSLPFLTKNPSAIAYTVEHGDLVQQPDEKNGQLVYLVDKKTKRGCGFAYMCEEGEAIYQQLARQLTLHRQFAREVARQSEVGMNVFRAWLMKMMWELSCKGEYTDLEIRKLNDDYIIKLPPDMEEMKGEEGPAPPRDMEDAGIVGFFDDIRQNARYTVIYENTLGYEIHGLDALLRDEETGHIIFIEIKGTSRKIASPLSYLKRTKRKGRQLSWEWLYRSLEEAAHSMASSALYLYCLPHLVHSTVERWLVISRSEVEAGRRVNKEVKVYKEDTPSGIPKLNDRAVLDRMYASYEPVAPWLEKIEELRP
ncbi:hypothetical protein AB9P05_21825 [Roseivirga sp. BDSF3-8]|uniref:hypothetical protein n=1 Tax=Roseivirga sp. BDSF3-8 TaxID=3241598 RepID=UPI003531FB9C